jgi:hypothetical protein
MVIRVSHSGEDGEHLGYSYHASVHQAKQYMKEHGGRVSDTAKTPKTKEGVLKLLRAWAEHPNNG